MLMNIHRTILHHLQTLQGDMQKKHPKISVKIQTLLQDINGVDGKSCCSTLDLDTVDTFLLCDIVLGVLDVVSSPPFYFYELLHGVVVSTTFLLNSLESGNDNKNLKDDGGVDINSTNIDNNNSKDISNTDKIEDKRIENNDEQVKDNNVIITDDKEEPGNKNNTFEDTRHIRDFLGKISSIFTTYLTTQTSGPIRIRILQTLSHLVSHLYSDPLFSVFYNVITHLTSSKNVSVTVLSSVCQGLSRQIVWMVFDRYEKICMNEKKIIPFMQNNNLKVNKADDKYIKTHISNNIQQESSKIISLNHDYLIREDSLTMLTNIFELILSTKTLSEESVLLFTSLDFLSTALRFQKIYEKDTKMLNILMTSLPKLKTEVLMMDVIMKDSLKKNKHVSVDSKFYMNIELKINEILIDCVRNKFTLLESVLCGMLTNSVDQQRNDGNKDNYDDIMISENLVVKFDNEVIKKVMNNSFIVDILKKSIMHVILKGKVKNRIIVLGNMYDYIKNEDIYDLRDIEGIRAISELNNNINDVKCHNIINNVRLIEDGSDNFFLFFIDVLIKHLNIMYSYESRDHDAFIYNKDNNIEDNEKDLNSNAFIGDEIIIMDMFMFIVPCILNSDKFDLLLVSMLRNERFILECSKLLIKYKKYINNEWKIILNHTTSYNKQNNDEVVPINNTIDYFKYSLYYLIDQSITFTPEQLLNFSQSSSNLEILYGIFYINRKRILECIDTYIYFMDVIYKNRKDMIFNIIEEYFEYIENDVDRIGEIVSFLYLEGMVYKRNIDDIKKLIAIYKMNTYKNPDNDDLEEYNKYIYIVDKETSDDESCNTRLIVSSISLISKILQTHPQKINYSWFHIFKILSESLKMTNIFSILQIIGENHIKYLENISKYTYLELVLKFVHSSFTKYNNKESDSLRVLSMLNDASHCFIGDCSLFFIYVVASIGRMDINKNIDIETFNYISNIIEKYIFSNDLNHNLNSKRNKIYIDTSRNNEFIKKLNRIKYDNDNTTNSLFIDKTEEKNIDHGWNDVFESALNIIFKYKEIERNNMYINSCIMEWLDDVTKINIFGNGEYEVRNRNKETLMMLIKNINVYIKKLMARNKKELVNKKNDIRNTESNISIEKSIKVKELVSNNISIESNNTKNIASNNIAIKANNIIKNTESNNTKDMESNYSQIENNNNTRHIESDIDKNKRNKNLPTQEDNDIIYKEDNVVYGKACNSEKIDNNINSRIDNECLYLLYSNTIKNILCMEIDINIRGNKKWRNDLANICIEGLETIYIYKNIKPNHCFFEKIYFEVICNIKLIEDSMIDSNGSNKQNDSKINNNEKKMKDIDNNGNIAFNSNAFDEIVSINSSSICFNTQNLNLYYPILVYTKILNIALEINVQNNAEILFSKLTRYVEINNKDINDYVFNIIKKYSNLKSFKLYNEWMGRNNSLIGKKDFILNLLKDVLERMENICTSQDSDQIHNEIIITNDHQANKDLNNKNVGGSLSTNQDSGNVSNEIIITNDHQANKDLNNKNVGGSLCVGQDSGNSNNEIIITNDHQANKDLNNKNLGGSLCTNQDSSNASNEIIITNNHQKKEETIDMFNNKIIKLMLNIIKLHKYDEYWDKTIEFMFISSNNKILNNIKTANIFVDCIYIIFQDQIDRSRIKIHQGTLYNSISENNKVCIENKKNILEERRREYILIELVNRYIQGIKPFLFTENKECKKIGLRTISKPFKKLQNIRISEKEIHFNNLYKDQTNNVDKDNVRKNKNDQVNNFNKDQINNIDIDNVRNNENYKIYNVNKDNKNIEDNVRNNENRCDLEFTKKIFSLLNSLTYTQNIKYRNNLSIECMKIMFKNSRFCNQILIEKIKECLNEYTENEKIFGNKINPHQIDTIYLILKEILSNIGLVKFVKDEILECLGVRNSNVVNMVKDILKKGL